MSRTSTSPSPHLGRRPRTRAEPALPRVTRVRRRAVSDPQILTLEVAPRPAATVETIRTLWSSALDAAAAAVRAAGVSLTSAELAELTRRLAIERASTGDLLDAIAGADGFRT